MHAPPRAVIRRGEGIVRGVDVWTVAGLTYVVDTFAARAARRTLR